MKLFSLHTLIPLLLTCVVLVILYSIITPRNQQGPFDIVTDKSSTTNDKGVPAGRLLMVGHFAGTPVASTTALIKDLKVGGVIIMSAPEDAEEIKSWTAAWQAASDFPLLIAIDQEGGPVSRLKSSDFIQTGQRNIHTKTEAYEVGKVRGKELAALGINTNFAPVLDTSTTPTSFMYSRTFPEGTFPAMLAANMYRGMQDAGVAAVAKHFPGHADTDQDSHEILPVVSIQKNELAAFTKNFRDYIAEANPRSLMTAHVLFPNIDTLPATLSPFFLQTYLREELGFTGMIITDDMSMNAIDENWDTSEATVLSLQAGADMVLFAAEPEKARAVVKEIESAVKSHTLDAVVLSEKIDRQTSALAEPAS